MLREVAFAYMQGCKISRTATVGRGTLDMMYTMADIYAKALFSSKERK